MKGSKKDNHRKKIELPGDVDHQIIEQKLPGNQEQETPEDQEKEDPNDQSPGPTKIE